LIELSAERYLRKLLGRPDIEDALKRLDKLTNEEARMATAQVLKSTHNIDDRVRVLSESVAVVDNKVTSIGERVTSVSTVATKVDGV